MKRKTISILFILMFLLPVMGIALETLSTVYVDGLAPMTLDGKLDDWEELDLTEVQLSNQISSNREVLPAPSTADCSPSFKCFADAKYVYVAIMVKDDDIIIGDHGFGEGWRDDSTTIYFDGDCLDISKDYYDANDGMLKVIGDSPDGIKYLEGFIPYFFNIQVPFFWESRGVKAGFQQNDTGYNVEAAIPIKMLGWNTIHAGHTMGMNIRVGDRDSDMDPELVDKGLIWASDPEHTSHYKTECYNRIVFIESVSMPGVVKSGIPRGISQSIGSDTLELEIELGTPDYADGTELFEAVLSDFPTSDFEISESKLIPINDAIWVKPLIAVIQFKQGKIEKGVQQIFAFGEICPDPFAEAWVQTFLKNEVHWIFEVYKGEIVDSESNMLENMNLISQEYLKKEPDDIESMFEIAKYLEREDSYGEAIMFYEKILNTSVSNADKYKAQLGIARNNFYLGDYNLATQMAEELINSDVDPEIVLDANMIVLSAQKIKE